MNPSHTKPCNEVRERLEEIAKFLAASAKAPYCEDAHHEHALWLRNLSEQLGQQQRELNSARKDAYDEKQMRERYEEAAEREAARAFKLDQLGTGGGGEDHGKIAAREVLEAERHGREQATRELRHGLEQELIRRESEDDGLAEEAAEQDIPEDERCAFTRVLVMEAFDAAQPNPPATPVQEGLTCDGHGTVRIEGRAAYNCSGCIACGRPSDSEARDAEYRRQAAEDAAATQPESPQVGTAQCDDCKGKGTVFVPDYDGGHREPCESCGGTGVLAESHQVEGPTIEEVAEVGEALAGDCQPPEEQGETAAGHDFKLADRCPTCEQAIPGPNGDGYPAAIAVALAPDGDLNTAHTAEGITALSKRQPVVRYVPEIPSEEQEEDDWPKRIKAAFHAELDERIRARQLLIEDNTRPTLHLEDVTVALDSATQRAPAPGGEDR